MESMLAAHPIPTNNTKEDGIEEEDFWNELIKKAKSLEIQEVPSKEHPEIQEEQLTKPNEEEDLIKDYLIEEYTKEIESYQTLL